MPAARRLTPEQRKANRKKCVAAYKARGCTPLHIGTGRPRVLTDEQRKANKKAASDSGYQKNKAKILARQAADYAANPEKFKVRHAAYIEANPEKAAKNSLAAWAAKNPERDKAARIHYRVKNKATIAVRVKRWHESHPERARKATAKHRAANRAEINKRSAARHKANPERGRAACKKWALAHPEECRAQNAKYRARKKGAKLGNQKVIVAWNKSWRSKKSVTCNWCRKSFSPKKCHADHITPLVKGGAHSIENLCISCSSCNHSKKDRTLPDWSARLCEPVLL